MNTSHVEYGDVLAKEVWLRAVTLITVWLRICEKSVTRGCDVQCNMVMHFMTSSTKGSDTEYGDVLLK